MTLPPQPFFVTPVQEKEQMEAAVAECRRRMETHRRNGDKLQADLCEADLNGMLDYLQTNFYGNASNESNGE